MKEEYKNYIIVGLSSVAVVLLIVVILLIVNGNKFSLSNNVNSDSKNETVEKNKESNKKDNDIKEEITNNNDNSQINSSSNNNIPSVNTSISSDNTNTYVPTVPSSSSTVIPNNPVVQTNDRFSSENELVSYFQNQSNLLDSEHDENNITFREKAKNGFVSIVDFIFYDKEIKGYTFKGLTNSAKLKVISIALTIDNQIEKYFPNYKENIKGKYINIKNTLAAKYIEITTKLCDEVGENTCGQFKEDYARMKESFGLTFSFIKNGASEIYQSATSSIKNWYEGWRYE